MSFQYTPTTLGVATSRATISRSIVSSKRTARIGGKGLPSDLIVYEFPDKIFFYVRWTINRPIMKPEKNTVRDLGWSVVGASLAIAIALWFVADGRSPFLLASLGGSTVFLFALTESEAAQPRALFGGHFGGALIGILAFQFFGDALWVSVLAVVLTMVFMVLTRTIHPPAGANPLFMVHNHAGMGILIKPVLFGVGLLFITAIIWSRIRPGKSYPVNWG